VKRVIEKKGAIITELPLLFEERIRLNVLDVASCVTKNLNAPTPLVAV
jgi:hypothetical protein